MGGGGTRGTSHRLSQQDHISITSESHLQQINTASQHLPTVSHHTSNQHLGISQPCHIDITSVSHQHHINSKTSSQHFHKQISSHINLSCQQFTIVSHRYHISITLIFKHYHISITPTSHQYHIGIISARRKRIFFRWNVP